MTAVPGEGPADAEIMFVGEAPGRQEDAEGRPFVGAAGRLLGELLALTGLRRDRVYITNVVKSRPTDRTDGSNRAPHPEEVAACAPWLDQQLAIIQPRLIVTLGAYALNTFLPGKKVSKVHGRVFRSNGHTILPLFHPAAALYGLRREILHRDFRRVQEVFAEIGLRQ